MKKKTSPEIEEYLETLSRYDEEGREPKVKHLAKDLGISAASVSQMLKRLAEKGLIKYERYGKIKLTKKGREIGNRILRKHRVIEKFLLFIGVKKNVHEEACILEHAISDEVENALRSTIDLDNVVRLSDLKKGERAKIIFVNAGTNACKRLAAMGLIPGTDVEVERASSRAGPVELSVRSSKLAVGRGLAKKIFVKVKK